MKKTNQEKGITLIALIITIIVLLILAAVTIRAVNDGGIIEYAQRASDEYQAKQTEEESILGQYAGMFEADAVATTIEEATSSKMLSKAVNSKVEDIYGNKITIPAGFKILVDDTTVYTKTDISVTKGIVIQDAAGNEFVWVPVGNIKTSTTDTTGTNIPLGRYASFVKDERGEYVPAQAAANYATATQIEYSTEYTDENRERDNPIARDIGAFCTNSVINGGYYIGRFEAGDSSSSDFSDREEEGVILDATVKGTLVCKKGQIPYNYILPVDASSECQNMYAGKPYTSDLMNSYAWDTAIIFIQTFGGRTAYYSENHCTSFTKTGLNSDKYCNIYDLSGNCHEWTTETFSYMGSATFRGGYYSESSQTPKKETSFRQHTDGNGGDNLTFRPIIYF